LLDIEKRVTGLDSRIPKLFHGLIFISVALPKFLKKESMKRINEYKKLFSEKVHFGLEKQLKKLLIEAW